MKKNRMVVESTAINETQLAVPTHRPRGELMPLMGALAVPDELLPKDGPLTAQQRTLRQELESAIEESLATAGHALDEINRSRLYREIAPTFDGYLALRWPGISRATAYRKIRHFQVETAIAKHAPDCPMPTQTMAQLLLGRPNLVKDWQYCVENGLTTVEDVAAHFNEIEPEKIEIEAKAAEQNPLALRFALHVPDNFVGMAKEMLGPHKHLLKDGRHYLRKRIEAASAGEWLIHIGQFIQDNSINPFTLTVSL